ncbi:MAG: two-component system response regulator [Sideroxydans sp.]|nr:two-component system response regulator [Sideroxydans sp.]
MTTKNVLVVDDEGGIRELLSEILFDEGYGVHLAENAAQARALLEQHSPDIVLLDIWMPDTDGLTLLKEWVAQGKLTMPVIMMSGHGTIETALEATRIGAADFLEKPIALKKLLATVAQVLQQSAITPMNSPSDEEDVIDEDGKLKVGLDLELPFREARERFDFLYLNHHINRSAGNIAEVADKIGIERTHLYRKLKQLGIKPPKRAGEDKL